MLIYIKLFLHSHFLLAIIIAVVYLIEKMTGKLILYQWFKYKKDLESAEGSADREALLYFLFNIGYAIYKVYIKREISEDFNIIIWLFIIIVLSIFVRKLYYKYQGKDSTKPKYGGYLD